MNSISKFDLDNEYRSRLSFLKDEALDVFRQYEYDDFEDVDFPKSYKRNVDWFLEGPLHCFEESSRGIKEHEKLRKGTKKLL